ncbi:MAG: acetate--CoA ligase alpha subunit [Candidatus Aquicultorales bacterium]
MLEALFCPGSIAVIGVGRRPGTVGRDIFDNLGKAGFDGAYYAVNPKADTIDGHKSYPSILDIPDDVDMAVVVVPAQAVPGVMDECGRKGVKTVIVISAGFKETGVEGARLERQLIEAAKAHGIRVLGPNCLGALNTYCDLNASFAPDMPTRGPITFISQSGALLTAILDWAKAEEIGFSKVISLGNKSDISEIDLLNALSDDPTTKVVCTYMEGVSRGREFMEAARRLARKKPLVVLKSGTTDAGARAVSSHTGTLAGSEAAYNSAFRQAGIIRADSVQDLFDYASALAYQPIPKKNAVAILTNAGGPGIMATDACERFGVDIAAFERETIEKLKAELPPAGSYYNPVDVLGDAKADRYRHATEVVLSDPNVGGAIVILTPQATTEIEETARVIAEAAERFHDKPVYACFMGGSNVGPGVSILRRKSIPNYYYPERAVLSFKAALDYDVFRIRPPETQHSLAADTGTVRRVFDESRKIGRRQLPEIEATQVAAAYRIPVTSCHLARSADEATVFAKDIGYPVVMKIASPDIIHKSDVGGIAVNIDNPDDLKDAYHKILDNVEHRVPEAIVWGICVNKMVIGAREFIVGMSRDPQFGPLIAFGLGGIYVEVLKDVSFRVAPLSEEAARQMITEIRAYPLVRGVRGQPPVDIDAIVDVLLKVSQLATDFPEIIEMDINPLMVYERGGGAIAADVRLSIGE